jgi:diguanylate cyclase (GGDEF)-like protein/PAS domain S-box-containing protein
MQTQQTTQLSTKGLIRGRAPDWAGFLTAGAGLYSLAVVVWNLLYPGGSFDVLSDAAVLPIGLVAAVLARRVSTKADLDPAVRRGWQFFAASFALCVAGGALRAYHALALGAGAPDPWWDDLLSVMRYPLMLAGVFAFPGLSAPRADRLRRWLDAATMIICGWMVTWYLMLGLTGGASHSLPLPMLLRILYPIGDLGVFFGVAMLAYRRARDTRDRALGPLAAGLFVLYLGRLIGGMAALQGWTPGTRWPEAILAVGLFLQAASANAQYRQVRRRKAADAAEGKPRWTAALPYLGIAVSYGLLLVILERDWHQVVLLIGALAVTLSVAIRQVVVLSQNGRLLRAAQELAEEVQRRENRFRSLVQHSTDVIAVVEYDGAIRYISPAIAEMLGRDPLALTGTSLPALVHPHDQNGFLASLAQEGTGRVQCRLQCPDETWRHVEITVNSLLHDPDLEGIVLNIRDVTERVSLESKMAHLAFHDSLTNLANRNLLRQRVMENLAECRRQGEPLSVLFLDLDGFKTVNDSLGHSAGDQLLTQVADRLQTCVRGSDTVARQGGDEFSILLPGADDAVASRVASRVIEVLGQTFDVAGRAVCVYASVGIVVCRDAELSADDLLRNADVAMYAAKARGKSCFAVFEQSMHEAAMQRLELEADLRFAVGNDEFVLQYQPAMRLSTGSIMGVEALVRWRHPTRGLIAPSDFIAVAEETGLIVPLGRWVLWESCRQAAVWQQRYPLDPPLKISVNLSPRQLEGGELVKDVAAALAEFRLAPGSLVLEVTETTLMQFESGTLRQLEGLKELGVMLAIDDFGTGYSALSYLRRFPADIVKIDRSFVETVGTGSRETALVRGIIELAHSLGMVTVAEGIERPEQLDQLALLHCNVGQGYFISRPVDAAQLTVLLDQSSIGGMAH